MVSIPSELILPAIKRYGSLDIPGYVLVAKSVSMTIKSPQHSSEFCLL